MFSTCCGNGRLLEVLQQLPDLPDELEQRVSGKDTSCRQFRLTFVHTTVHWHSHLLHDGVALNENLSNMALYEILFTPKYSLLTDC